LLKLVYTLDLPPIYDHVQWGMMMNQWIYNLILGVLAINEWIPCWDAVFWKQIAVCLSWKHGAFFQLGGDFLSIKPGDLYNWGK